VPFKFPLRALAAAVDHQRAFLYGAGTKVSAVQALSRQSIAARTLPPSRSERSSTIYYSGGNQTVSARNDYASVVLEGSGIKTLAGASSGSVRADSLYLASGVSMTMGNQQVSFNGTGAKAELFGTVNTARNQGLINADSTAFSNVNSPTITFHPSSRVNYNSISPGTQYVSTGTFGNMTFSNSTPKVLLGNLTLTGNAANTFLINSTATVDAGNFQVSFTQTGATVTINGTL
jgi:hypothetical protein